MKQLISLIGACDGEGNTSSMRILLLLIAAAVIGPKIVLAVKSGVPPTWTAEDMEMIGVAMTGKLVQNQQENQAPPTTPKAT